MSKGELIDEHVSLRQLELAVESLLTHEAKKEQTRQETELLPGKEQNVWLNITVKKIPSGHKFKPAKIPIAHPLVDPRVTPVCLITKDPQREYKDLLEMHKIKFISRVVGIEKLKGKFKPFEARRMLLKENGLFLADERIIPLLPKLLGSKWFEAKKQPIPVCLTRKDLKGELERAISSTYMNQNQGTCTSIKIGTLSQTPAQVLANLQKGLPAVIKHIKDGWENVQSIHIKTNSSVSLPVWSCNLDEGEGGRWNGLTAQEVEDDEDDVEMSEADTKKLKEAAPSKGKTKRSSEDGADEEDDKPKKKAKGTTGSVVADTPAAKAKASSKAALPVSANTDTPSKITKRKATAIIETDKPSDAPRQAGSAPKSSKTAQADRQVNIIDSETPSTKKGKGRKSITSDAMPSATQPSATQPAETVIKSKKAKTLGADAVDQPTSPAKIAVSSEPEKATPEMKKKSRSTLDPPTSEPQQVSYTAQSKATAQQKRKETKSAKPATEEVAKTTTSLTKGEMKQKRSAGAGEKKKEKVIKSKGGKSAKDGIIGKKVAQG